MRSNSEVLVQWANEIPIGWQHIRNWAERVFTRERKAEIALLAFTLALWAVLLFYLYKPLQSYTIVDMSPYLSSLNSQLAVRGY